MSALFGGGGDAAGAFGGVRPITHNSMTLYMSSSSSSNLSVNNAYGSTSSRKPQLNLTEAVQSVCASNTSNQLLVSFGQYANA